jgi:hypothetical protein
MKYIRQQPVDMTVCGRVRRAGPLNRRQSARRITDNLAAYIMDPIFGDEHGVVLVDCPIARAAGLIRTFVPTR